MKKIKTSSYVITIIICTIAIWFSFLLGFWYDDTIDPKDFATYTEYLKELDSNSTKENTENNTYIKKGLEYKVNATRYIVNVTIENKRDNPIFNVEVRVEFKDINDTYIGSKSSVIKLIPKGYDTNISVYLMREYEYFPFVNNVSCKILHFDE